MSAKARNPAVKRATRPVRPTNKRIWRSVAALSVALNIAEGSGKTTDKELNRYLNISLGFLYETMAAMDALKLNGMVQEERYDEAMKQIDGISNQLGGLKKTLVK